MLNAVSMMYISSGRIQMFPNPNNQNRAGSNKRYVPVRQVMYSFFVMAFLGPGFFSDELPVKCRVVDGRRVPAGSRVNHYPLMEQRAMTSRQMKLSWWL
ncbi:MAG: hypothetical protein IPI71_02120 [Methanolinea sp.]|nr:MAG: hypothetical protein IPI71_02120 [Methanolinea sp.]